MYRSLLTVALIVAACAGSASAAWSFGVMADTQWAGTDPTGNNVNTVAVNQAKACNQAFVNAGVDFVVQVGDLGDNGSVASLQTRLNANTALNAAGIPFYGLRGNHEDNSAAKSFFQSNYIPASTPTATVAVAPDGVNYSVTHNGTKIVLLDILTADSTGAMDAATTWTDSQLKTADHTQAFGGSNDANPAQQNAFLSTLQNNGVRYAISGHDHIHHRSQVTSPDGNSKVQELICASDSYKYYTPGAPYSSREAPISQQMNQTGYYIFTVDGPRVTGKYYHTTPLSNGDVPANPTWTLGETFGYSLNGKEFLVNSGADLSVVQDAYGTTSMHLSGGNGSTAKTYDGRLVSKDINTGWTDKAAGNLSDALTLWGMEDIDAAMAANAFTLTMGYSAPAGYAGDVYLARQNADGSWAALASTVNADGTISAVVTQDGTFAVVPEPITIGLLAAGSLLVAARRRRLA